MPGALPTRSSQRGLAAVGGIPLHRQQPLAALPTTPTPGSPGWALVGRVLATRVDGMRRY